MASVIRVFTDGSCTRNGKKGARAGVGVVFPDHMDQSWGEPLAEGDSQTNQTAELTAILKGVQHAQTICGSVSDHQIRVYTDSEYSINCLTKWLPGWKKRDWKTADGKPVVHRVLIEAIVAQLFRFSGHVFTHVKAHTGAQDEHSRWNQVADDLAQKAVQDMKKVGVADLAHIPAEHPKGVAIPGIPLALMGPPVAEDQLVMALRSNITALDPDALNSGLLMALRKTLRKLDYDVETSKRSKQIVYRLIEKSHLTIQRGEDIQDE